MYIPAHTLFWGSSKENLLYLIYLFKHLLFTAIIIHSYLFHTLGCRSSWLWFSHADLFRSLLIYHFDVVHSLIFLSITLHFHWNDLGLHFILPDLALESLFLQGMVPPFITEWYFKVQHGVLLVFMSLILHSLSREVHFVYTYIFKRTHICTYV